MQKSAKTEAENEREQLLVDQCVFLTEEQEYVMVPAPGSGVPGKRYLIILGLTENY